LAGPVELLQGAEYRDVGLVDAPVAGDQVETELADVPGLEIADRARDQVVVENVHDRHSRGAETSAEHLWSC
jgi:hypothetical protein